MNYCRLNRMLIPEITYENEDGVEMSFDFELNLPVNWEERWHEVETAAQKYNVSLVKNGNYIQVRGKSPLGDIGAEIEVKGLIATVKITEKPDLVPKSLIESELRKALEKLT
ncbi:MAG: hypothetical protein CO189_08370 [candidate division Zixibacteria bacterium CG_4_9_14_3_um_filter_46_8]|nr:MAG: hypothetical protein CO189_08370 [candidate division Zixibacteria bacterium CG_4_9_14_3_um_filter_46_8]